MRVDLILPFALHYSNELASLFEKCIFCLHICVGNLNVDYRRCHHQASPFAPLHHYLPRLTRTCVKENFNIDYTAAAVTERLHHLLMDIRSVLHARIGKYLCHCRKDALGSRIWEVYQPDGI